MWRVEYLVFRTCEFPTQSPLATSLDGSCRKPHIWSAMISFSWYTSITVSTWISCCTYIDTEFYFHWDWRDRHCEIKTSPNDFTFSINSVSLRKNSKLNNNNCAFIAEFLCEGHLRYGFTLRSHLQSQLIIISWLNSTLSPLQQGIIWLPAEESCVNAKRHLTSTAFVIFLVGCFWHQLLFKLVLRLPIHQVSRGQDVLRPYISLASFGWWCVVLSDLTNVQQKTSKSTMFRYDQTSLPGQIECIQCNILVYIGFSLFLRHVSTLGISSISASILLHCSLREADLAICRGFQMTELWVSQCLIFNGAQVFRSILLAYRLISKLAEAWLHRVWNGLTASKR